MIEALRIRDFALVDQLDLELSPGFTVLTGETGAGKSILLQALGLLLGDRASRESVRAGADSARVEGVFLPSGTVRLQLKRILEEAGLPWDDAEPVIVSRTVSSDGRSRAYVNGAMAPLSVLAGLGRLLVEVSSQHQHQGLLREETHLDLVDRAMDQEGQAVLKAYNGSWTAWQEADAELRRLEGLEARARERADWLRFHVDEIRAARLEPGEDERLRGERDLLAHAEKLLAAYGQAEAEIYSGGEAALDRLARASRAVEDASRRDPVALPILELLTEAKAPLEEAALRLRDRQSALEADPRRLETIEERLELLRRLERKHGAGVSAILDRLQILEAELWEAENTEVALDRARAERERKSASLKDRAAELSRARSRTAQQLEEQVGREMDSLSLGRSAFRVSLESEDLLGSRGAESSRFLLAPNPGEPPLPLARIASGGELSRVLLALKNALRDTAVETLVFDEVDAGVGGVVADAVGDRLAALAPACQVWCVTHLPQIACRADHHLHVEKQLEGGRTVTRVRRLEAAERIEELARMLGGRHVTETTREHARELVERCAS